LPSLSEAARVLDRRRGARRELLEPPYVVVAEVQLGRAREYGQVPELLAAEVAHRHREAAVDHLAVRLHLRGRVLVGDRDRARLAPVRGTGDGLPLGLLRREAERRDDRLALVAAQRDERGVGSVLR